MDDTDGADSDRQGLPVSVWACAVCAEPLSAFTRDALPFDPDDPDHMVFHVELGEPVRRDHPAVPVHGEMLAEVDTRCDVCSAQPVVAAIPTDEYREEGPGGIGVGHTVGWAFCAECADVAESADPTKLANHAIRRVWDGSEVPPGADPYEVRASLWQHLRSAYVAMYANRSGPMVRTGRPGT